MARLCDVCKHINFAAIMTPRERDQHTGQWKSIFRPEWSGNGEDPCLGWPQRGAPAEDNPYRRRLPHIRTLTYDELSDVTASDVNETAAIEEPEVDPADVSAGSPGCLADSLSDAGDSISLDTSEQHLSSRRVSDGSSQDERSVADSLGLERSNVEREALNQPGEDVERGLIPSTVDNVADGGTSEDDSDERLAGGLNPLSVSSARSYSTDSRRDRSNRGGMIEYASSSRPTSFTLSADSRFDRDQKIDITKQSQGNWNYEHGQFYTLGSIWDVRSRRYSCELCAQLWKRLRKEYEVKNVFLLKSRCIMKLIEFRSVGKEGDLEREVVMLNLLFIFGFKREQNIFFFGADQDWKIKLSYVFHGTHKEQSKIQQIDLPNKSSSWQDDLFGEARTIYQICNYPLFRKWLACCEEQHGHEDMQDSGGMTVRFIDVQRDCLVEWAGPVAEVPRFVALSYVWGQSPRHLLLTTDNIHTLMQPGALKSHIPSATIEDAIELVREIHEPYLWVDALCILQDSPEDKLVQLPQMYNIYSKAILTVVAASGQDADAGLPGVQPYSRHTASFSLDLEDIDVSIRPSTGLWQTAYNIGLRENYLSNYAYRTRAWTLQEALLSKRALVFTRDQVYWECSTGTWCEGTHWESSSLRYINQRAIKESTPFDVWTDNFDRQAYDTITPAESVTYETQPNSYENLVRDYTQRDLTHDGDILNAFNGILSLIEKREETKFLFALREKHFGNDLLFNISSAVPRRAKVDDTPMPSWSWPAWKGTAEFANEARNSSADLVENLVPCDGVRCHVLVVDGEGRKSLRVVNSTGGWQFYSGYVRSGEGIYDPTSFYIGPEGSNEDHTDDSREAIQEDQSVATWAANVVIESDESEDHAADAHYIADPTVSLIRNTTHPKDADSSDLTEKIPEHNQRLTISDLESHLALHLLQPQFHIIFATFSSTVELITEEDEFNRFRSGIITGGTKRQRRNGINSRNDVIQRKLFLYDDTWRDQPSIPAQQGQADRENESKAAHDTQAATGTSASALAPPIATSDPRPRGPYFGHLPELSASTDPNSYMTSVPDGIYTVLWMNNNQLPMLGHLLCRPVWDEDGRETGILERVAGVVGPVEILSERAQRMWRAVWGVHVLG